MFLLLPAILEDILCGRVPVESADPLAGGPAHHNINVPYNTMIPLNAPVQLL